MRFPGHRLDDVPDNGRVLPVPTGHKRLTDCPGAPRVVPGTLVGRIVGRALDSSGNPLQNTIRQENYMEARFEIPPQLQRALAKQLQVAGDDTFALPAPLARTIVAPGYLGQLDVSPLGGPQVGGQINTENIALTGRHVNHGVDGVQRVYVAGTSDVSGSQAQRGGPTDGRQWDHSVRLRWEGYLDVVGDQITALLLTAHGSEQLQWNGRPARDQQR